MSELAFEIPDGAERSRLGAIVSHALGFPLEDHEGWFEKAGHEHLRVLKRGDRVVAGLVHIPMGQFFGGASVPTVGIAGVGVSPEERGAGVGTALMLASLRETRAKGIPLSTLYPATITLYRRAGYEVGGSRFRIEIDPRLLDVDKPAGTAFVEYPGLLRAEDIPNELSALYAESARLQPGHLDRGPYVWERTVSPRGHHGTSTFATKIDGRLEGYVTLSHKLEPGSGSTVTVSDLVAISSRAARAILWLLAQYRSVGRRLVWFGAQVDLFTSQLVEQHHSCTLAHYFMLRIVEPAAALTARGYPRSIATEVVLDLDDRSLPENSGVSTLSIANGRGMVTSGAKAGIPRIRLDERALATIYAGHTDAMTAAQAGWIDGDADAVDRVATIFASPPPSMRDFF